ncbi:MAG: ATP-binding protein [Candidatus Gastranaerophilales bacterium]|nr:ATP-binding protein [Candidatus Gastranaerophilales bacterium]
MKKVQKNKFNPLRIIGLIDAGMKKNAMSLGAVFLIFMDVIMLITIISMTAYFMQTSKNLTDKSFEERETVTKSIANIIYSAVKEGNNTNNYTILHEVTQKLIDNKLINFVVVYTNDRNNKDKLKYNDATQRIIWTTIPDITNKKLSINQVKMLYTKDYPYDTNIRIESGLVAQKLNVVIAYTLDSNISYYIKDINTKNPTLAVIFLLLSSFATLIIIKLVISPINSLTKGVKIFSTGNFQHKIPMSNYKELNILIRAFNEMAGIIFKTHASLQEKIEERTLEISDKNAQLNKAMNELKETQAMLVHGEKMRSLGELVAGITHEINNPVNFIYGNLTHLNNYSQDLMDIIDKYNEYVDLLPDAQKEETKKLLADSKYDYLKDDLPDLIKSCKEGTVRTRNIVMDLKNFSRSEKMTINEIDVNKELDTTLNILYNKYKNKVTIHKEYGELSMLDCYGGQLNQVFMNIIDNAIFAIKEQGDIFLRTKDDGNNIIVEIEDTGTGIAKENIEKVFEPFFTTKGVGEGTGLGMSITYKIIQTHGGKVDIDSELGRGTKFTITLPKDALKNKEEVENV